MNVKFGAIDRKSVLTLVGGVALILAIRYGVYGDREAPSVTSSETIPQAEQRLKNLRQAAATVEGKEERLKKASSELADREKGILQAPTEAQAQAQLLETLNNLARGNGIATQGGDFRDKPLSRDYGEVSVTVRFTCDIVQLVNLMAALADHQQILATDELRITGGNDKKKNVQVLLTVSTVVARKLLPEKKGGTLF
jgi:Tfp pilus assembly protein PilO